MPLEPILNQDTTLLFVALNPDEFSGKTGHHFARNEIFWDSLFFSDLTTEAHDMKEYLCNMHLVETIAKIKGKPADVTVFKGSEYNAHNWVYSIDYLVPDVFESNVQKVSVQLNHSAELLKTLKKLQPAFCVLLHTVIREEFVDRFLKRENKLNREELARSVPERERALLDAPKIGKENGPLGRIIKDLDTYFLTIPAPNHRYGNDEAHRQNWKVVLNTIERVMVI